MARQTGESADEPARASLFDLRTIIAVLFSVYGLVLLAVGLFDTDAGQRAKAGGLNLNLWTGGALLVLGVVFVAWARLRPLQPGTAAEDEDDEDALEGPVDGPPPEADPHGEPHA